MENFIFCAVNLSRICVCKLGGRDKLVSSRNLPTKPGWLWYLFLWDVSDILTYFWPILLFCTLLETTENQHFSGLFRGYGQKWFNNRSSRSQMFFKIGALKSFTIFTVKHLCWSLFLIKLQA